MDIHTGRYDWPQAERSNLYTPPFPKDTLNNLLNGAITNGKKQTLFAVKIQLTSYDVDSDHCVKTKEEFFEKLTSNLTEALLSFTIQKETQVNPFFADGYMSIISGFMCRQLSELHKELFNTLPVVTADKELSLLIFHAAANGLMNYMRGSKQSKMDWFTTPDIVQKCETSGE